MEKKTKHQPQPRSAKPANLTGIPVQLKREMERRSGLSFDDVRVHYNSDMPARIGALAYTQGNRVHIGPGQERHLPHELGHVVQQKLGIVQDGKTMAAGRKLNTDPVLERQADDFARGNVPIRQALLARARPNSPAGAWIQRKAAVGVTLSTVSQERFWASELKVDTLTFGGREDPHLPILRTDTRGGMKLEENSDTQGAHTFADAFVKKHQKDVVKGLPLSEALEFYAFLVDQLEKREIGQEATDLSGFDPVLALPLAARENESAVKRAGEFREAYVQALLKRRALCLQKIELLRRSLDGMQSGPARPMTVWNVLFKHLVSSYNQAYALGSLSTVGVGTSGRGEASGLYALKQEKLQQRFHDLGISKSGGTESKSIESKIMGHLLDLDFADKFFAPACAHIGSGSLKETLQHDFQTMMEQIRKNRSLNASNSRHSYVDLLRYYTQLPVASLDARTPKLYSVPEQAKEDGQARGTVDPKGKTQLDYNGIFAFLRNAFTFFANLENYAALFALDEFTIRMLPLEKLCGIETLDAAARQEQVNELAETAELAEPQEIFGDYEGQAFDDWSFDSKAETFSALTALLPIAVPWCRTLNISNGIYLITPFPQGMEDVNQWISIVHKNARSLAETVYPDEFPDQQEKDMISLRREPKEPENERYEEDL